MFAFNYAADRVSIIRTRMLSHGVILGTRARGYSWCWVGRHWQNAVALNALVNAPTTARIRTHTTVLGAYYCLPIFSKFSSPDTDIAFLTFESGTPSHSPSEPSTKNATPFAVGRTSCTVSSGSAIRTPSLILKNRGKRTPKKYKDEHDACIDWN